MTRTNTTCTAIGIHRSLATILDSYCTGSVSDLQILADAITAGAKDLQAAIRKDDMDKCHGIATRLESYTAKARRVATDVINKSL